MPLPLSADRIQELFGALYGVLYRCPAARMPVIAGEAGWDIGMIPDGIDESGSGVRRPPIGSAILGQWNQWEQETKISRLRNLGEVLTQFLISRGEGEIVNASLLKHGYRFENGDFVPVDATGNIPL